MQSKKESTMTLEEINNIKAGDILKLERPGNRAAAELRQRILKVYSPFPGLRVASVQYFQKFNGVEEIIGENDCELNMNLFGSSICA